MTLLKLQNIMSYEIGKRSFLSRPPEPPASALMNDPFQAIYIGTTSIFKIPFSWSFLNLANPHIGVFGITGSGKSFLVKTLLRRANYVWNSNAIIIDFAGEYKSWVEQTRGKVISLAKGDYLNIMDLAGMKPLDRVKQIITSLDILTDIGTYTLQQSLTQDALEQAYVNEGFVLYENPPLGKEVPTLKNVISLLEEKLQEGTYEYPAELESSIHRLRQFAREGEDYFARKSSLDLGKLAESGLVDIDLSGLPDEKFRALAALFILQTLKEKMRSEGWSESKGLKAIVVLDEAWKVASDERSDAITFAREGRKYQYGLIVASQSPLDVSETIFSLMGTTFVFRLKDENYVEYIQRSLKFSDFVKEDINKFGVGQAAVHMTFQTSISFPSTFVLEKIHGEGPLFVYSLDLTDVLTQSEISAGIIQKEYQLERDEIRNKFIEYNMNVENINDIFASFDSSGRAMKILDFIRILKSNGVVNPSIVAFLKSLSIEDQIITRIISYSGGDAKS